MGTVKDIARNPYLKSVMGRYIKTVLTHPVRMGKEHAKCFKQWLLGPDIPVMATRMELHSHTDFSGRGFANAGQVISLLLKSVHIWSPTDYDTTGLFDSLGKGNLLSDETYCADVHSDGRSLRISNKGNDMIILRSMEARTGKGHIGIHGFSGKPPPTFNYEEMLRFSFDSGAFVVLNHPYFWAGVGWNGNDVIDTALEIAERKGGVIALEKNATEIPPQIYCTVLSEIMAKKLNIPLVASGDAHTLGMYGKTGIAFPLWMPIISMTNPADEIQKRIKNHDFFNYFNYSTPKEFLGFFKF